MARNYHQGEYQIQNWDKYIGTKNPRFLSSWEEVAFKISDTNPRVLKWGSETVVVPYFDPIKNKQRRYLVDLYLKYESGNGTTHEEIVEIKPFSQTHPPKIGKKKKQTLMEEQTTWITNQAKWDAAIRWADKHGMKFRILTEKSLKV